MFHWFYYYIWNYSTFFHFHNFQFQWKQQGIRELGCTNCTRKLDGCSYCIYFWKPRTYLLRTGCLGIVQPILLKTVELTGHKVLIDTSVRANSLVFPLNKKGISIILLYKIINPKMAIITKWWRPNKLVLSKERSGKGKTLPTPRQ